MKTIEVVAAVICSTLHCKEKVFATARGYGAYKGMWEFPGGKIEQGETPQEALVREIKEELNVEILVGDYIKTVEYNYPEFHLSMKCYWCEVSKGQLQLNEALEARWLSKTDINSLNWLPADILLLSDIEREMS